MKSLPPYAMKRPPILEARLRIFLEKRIKLLHRIEKCWRQTGETECAAIYHGAASELQILLGQKIT